MGGSNEHWGALQRDDTETAGLWDASAPLPLDGERPRFDHFLAARNIDRAALARTCARYAPDFGEDVVMWAWPGGAKFRNLETGRRWNTPAYAPARAHIIPPYDGRTGTVLLAAEGETDAARLNLLYPFAAVAILPLGAEYIPAQFPAQCADYEAVYACHDADAAGDLGAAKMLGAIPQAARHRPPEQGDNDWACYPPGDDPPKLPPPPDACGSLVFEAFADALKNGVPEPVQLIHNVLYEGAVHWVDAHPGSGKAQPHGSKVLTPQGWRNIEDLRVGDPVRGTDGGTYAVSGVFPQGPRPCSRVTTTDGGSTLAADDHLWAVDEPGRRVVVTTAALNKGRSPDMLPALAPVAGTPLAGEHVEPYALGLLLGDGSFRTGTLKFTTADPELLEPLRALGLRPVPARPGRCYDYRLNGGGVWVTPWLKEQGLWEAYSYEKFVPAPYMTAAPAERLALLQGLMDTDGSASRTSNEFCSTSAVLAAQVRELAWSLGCRATYSRQPAWLGEVRHHDRYRVAVSPPPGLELFRLTRKPTGRPQRQRPGRLVAAVEAVGERECVCIMVTAPDHLYVTDDYIPTHNTTLVMAWCHQHMLTGGHVVWLDYEGGLGPSVRRFNAVGLSYATAREHMHFASFPKDAEDSMAQLAARYPGAVVVFDSASKALSLAGRDENSNAEVVQWTMKLVRAAKMHGLTVVVIDHITKNGEASQYSRGATTKEADTDVHWRAIKVVEFDRNNAGVVMLVRKKDREGFFPQAQWFAVGDGAGGLPVTPCDPPAEPAANDQPEGRPAF